MGRVFESRVAVVTGSSSGIGAAVAIELARRGASVVAVARREDRLRALADRIRGAGGNAVCRSVDVTDPVACDQVADFAMEHFGSIDLLFNGAGIGAAVPATREDPASFRRVVETNLMGSYWMAQASARHMERGASIVNVASILAFTSAGLPQAAYAASKAGLLGLTRDLAQQWSGRKGIRVNAVAPGFFATEMTDQLADGYLEEMVQRRIPLHRLGELSELAATVCFLMSDEAAYITGVTLPVDGGLLTN